jgi:IS30 family transposase
MRERPLYRVRPRHRLNRDQLNLIWVMYAEGGVSIREIALEVGRAEGTISTYLRELRAAKGGMEYLNSIGEPTDEGTARRRRRRMHVA